MKSLSLVPTFFAVCLFFNCNSQSKSIKAGQPGVEAKDTAIFIYGKIYNKQTKEPLNAYCEIKGTKINCRADESGNYKLDITKIVDTTKTYVLNVSYVNYGLSETVIKGKIQRSFYLDMVVRADGEKNRMEIDMRTPGINGSKH